MKPPIQLLATTLMFAASHAFAQGLTTVTIGWGAYPDVPQLAQASDKGLWAGEKIEAKIVPFASGRQGFEALIGGQLDYAIMAEFPAVTGVMRNQKFSVVAVLSQYKSFRLITKGANAPTGLTALAGKKIAMPLGTNVHFAIASALEKAGVNAELVNVPPSEMIPAIARGDVDAIMSFPSGYQKAKSILGAQYQEVRLPDYSSSFLLAASEKATANPALTQRVLAALLKGEALVKANAAESQEATARYVGSATTLQAVRAAWPEYEFRIKLDQAMLDTMVKEGQWLRAKGLIKEGDPTPALYRKWLVDGPLKALDPSRVTLAP